MPVAKSPAVASGAAAPVAPGGPGTPAANNVPTPAHPGESPEAQQFDAEGNPIKKKRIQKRTPRAEWGARDAEGNLTAKIPNGTQPGDYDRKKFLPLHKADFENSADYTEWLAVQFDQKAAALHKRATEERTLGSAADRAKAKKLRSLHDKLAALEKELREGGLDVDALLKD